MRACFFFLVLFLCAGCRDELTTSTIVSSNDYKIHLTGDRESTLIVIFPGLGQSIEMVEESFEILKPAITRNVSVLLLSFNDKLHLSSSDKKVLTNQLDQIISDYNLSPHKIILGGFSSGGIISCLLGQSLLASNHPYAPDQIFVIDSPLDLKELYIHVTGIDSTAHSISKEESSFLTNYFSDVFPESKDILSDIPKVSPFDFETGNLTNISMLQRIPMRVYTEPDSVWWMENRGFEFEATNGFQLTRFVEYSKSQRWEKLELIQTKNKGFRPNGNRHPHSWSIVDVDNLLDWITNH